MKKLVFILMFLGLLVSAAHADTCGASLMPPFTATQATQLCAKFGSATNHSLIPSADNTYDVGSSTFGWRTGYFDTSLIAPLWQSTGDVQIKVDSDAQRLFNIGASSDTAFTFTYGDAGVTAAQVLFVGPATADADDDGRVSLSGGGGAAETRGAFFSIYGNENATAGFFDAYAGNVAGAKFRFGTTADAAVEIYQNNSLAWQIDTDSNLTGVGQLTSSNTGSLGWSYVTGANTACTTTCTSAAVFGVDLAAGASQPVIVAASSATADACVCAGAS